MPTDIFTATAQDIRKKADRHNSVLVCFSGGKDSLCVLDLCCRAFQNVVALQMQFLPGLRFLEEQVEYVKARYGVEVLLYPDPVFLSRLKSAEWSPESNLLDDIPSLSMQNMIEVAAREAGIELVATGVKKLDGMNKAAVKIVKLWHPIFHWRHQDVLAYLAIHKIPAPSTDGRNSASLDLTLTSIFWLHDNYPDDFAKVERYFPFIGAAVKRRDWYGVTA